MNEKLFWLDIETTGLDPEKCVILEVAAAVTDAKLDVIDSLSCLVKSRLTDVFDPGDNWIDSTHGTGISLIQQVLTWPTDGVKGLTWDSYRHGTPLRDVERSMMVMASRHFTIGNVVLAGNSIHFDRSFVEVHMPGFARLLHHRQVDVSSFRVLADIIAPVRTKPTRSRGKPAHRAVKDVEGSIAELKSYIRTGFIVGDETTSREAPGTSARQD